MDEDHCRLLIGEIRENIDLLQEDEMDCFIQTTNHLIEESSLFRDWLAMTTGLTDFQMLHEYLEHAVLEDQE